MTSLQPEKLETIGRNDPCLCGSGKKYKKCCEGKETEKLLRQEQDQILQAVLMEFFENHPRPSQQKDLMEWKNNTENLLVPLYGEEKSGGIIGDVFFFSEQAAIWNAFIEQRIQQEERMQIGSILKTWINPLFLAGEIQSITNYRAQLRDILSQTVYEIDVNESFPVEIGTIAFGFYLPDLRVSERFLMVLNSITVAMDVHPETIQKLKDMFTTSHAKNGQEFYKQNIIAIYQMFSSGLRGAQEVADDVLEAVQKLEQFLIDQDLKSDELIEVFFHYLKSLPKVPAAAIGGAVQFGIQQNLMKFDWTLEKIAAVFKMDQKEISLFTDELHDFYQETVAEQEKEAEFAFEVGTNPKTNELQNWQLFMHLKNAAITSESALKRHMEYYHAKPYQPKSDAEKAQLLAYELFANGTSSLLPDDIQRVRNLDPQLTDGFLLAAETEKDAAKRKSILNQAAASGKRHYEQEMEIPWLYIANRPYLRSLFALGVHHWEQGDFEAAFTEFQQLLQSNPGDHQGARYLALSSLIALGRLDEAESLIGHYEDEYSDNAFYTWFKWLIQRKRNLHSKATQDLFLEAIEQNPYMKKHVEKRPPAMPYPKKTVISPRSPEEAHLIWSFLAPGLLSRT